MTWIGLYKFTIKHHFCNEDNHEATLNYFNMLCKINNAGAGMSDNYLLQQGQVD